MRLLNFTILFVVASLYIFGMPVRADVCTSTMESDELIQAAIDAASSGQTICIPAGEYEEDLVLKSGVSLEGQYVDQTIKN